MAVRTQTCMFLVPLTDGAPWIWLRSYRYGDVVTAADGVHIAELDDRRGYLQQLEFVHLADSTPSDDQVVPLGASTEWGVRSRPEVLLADPELNWMDQGFVTLRIKNSTVMVNTPDNLATQLYDLSLFGHPSQRLQLPPFLTMRGTVLDCDSKFLFMAGRGPTTFEVHAYRRSDANPLWSLTRSPYVPSRHSTPTLTEDAEDGGGQGEEAYLWGLHFPSLKRREGEDCSPGIPGYYRGQLSILGTLTGIQSRFFIHMVEVWQMLDDDDCVLVETDESRGLMVVATRQMLILIQDYRRVLVDSTYRPVLSAYIDLTHPIGTPVRDAQQRGSQGGRHPPRDEHLASPLHLWQDDSGTWDSVCWVPSMTTPALSVRDGRVFWVGIASILFDLSHGPTRPEGIRITLLWPESGSVGKRLPIAPFAMSESAALGPQGNQMYTIISQSLGPSLDSNQTYIAQWDLTGRLSHQVNKLLHQQTTTSHKRKWDQAI